MRRGGSFRSRDDAGRLSGVWQELPGQAFVGSVLLGAMPQGGIPCMSVSVPDVPAPSAAPGVIDLGRLSGDTIADRRWRIVPDAGPYTLQCDALGAGRLDERPSRADDSSAAPVRLVAWLDHRSVGGSRCPPANSRVAEVAGLDCRAEIVQAHRVYVLPIVL
jgi:hypothetical protein